MEGKVLVSMCSRSVNWGCSIGSLAFTSGIAAGRIFIKYRAYRCGIPFMAKTPVYRGDGTQTDIAKELATFSMKLCVQV